MTRRARTPAAQAVLWRVGKYIRLSREDGSVVSESVVNQDKILTDELPRFFPDGQFEVVDAYIDDGTSGTTDMERESFQRMIADIKAGKINCVIVKNLSRAFRNSADQGHFLEEFLPLYGVRFISLYQPAIDTYLDAEVVHGLEVGITGFMNEQYAYKTSADIRRTFKHKREKGEFIGAFAPYGYEKDPRDKNVLVVDQDAARVVRDIFTWYVSGGMSKRAIARRLNELGVPNPTAYKRARGLHYENPNAGQNDGLWSMPSVSRILSDPVYTGVMRQGRQRVISYKVHKRTAVPEDQWYVVENAVPPIVSRETFQAAARLSQRDTRTPAGNRQVYLFAGLVRCAGCQKGMYRHTSRQRVYYKCRTHAEKGPAFCSTHTIRADALEAAVLATVRALLALLDDPAGMAQKIDAAPVLTAEAQRLDGAIKQRARELERTAALADGLYMDWKNGDIDRDQYRRMKAKCDGQREQLRQAIARIQAERAALSPDAADPYLAAFLQTGNIPSLSRGLLTALVDTIYVHENGALDISFRFQDPFHSLAGGAGE